jgi:hypothetical protein
MKLKKDNSTNFSDVEYLTRRESAIFLRLSISSFDKIKDIDRIKYGKSIRFSINSLREYAARHTVSGSNNIILTTSTDT